LDFIRNYEGIDPSKTGILGHSDGGWIAAMAAADRPDPAFIVMLAGPALRGEELSILQSTKLLQSMGASEDKIKETETINRKVYSLAKNESDTAVLRIKIKEIMSAAGAGSDAQVTSIMNSVATPWFKRYLTLEPKEYLEKINCPVLALFGEKDFQVPAEANIKVINDVVKNTGKKNITVKVISGVNHLFQKAETGMMNEYGNPDIVMNDETLQTIYQWMSDIDY
jgi:pimeloyl-ACP methyl ester carboxylesterase